MLGIDYGFHPDPCAFTVTASRRNDPKVRVVFSSKRGQVDDIEFAQEAARSVDRFKPVAIVGDTAGVGSRAMGMFNKRYGHEIGVWIKSAEKHDKLASISLMNTAFRKDRLEVVACEETQELSKELASLQWRNEKREEIHLLYPDHAFDSLRYGFNEHHVMVDAVDHDTHTGRATNNSEAHQEMLRDMARVRERQEEEREMLGELMGGWG